MNSKNFQGDHKETSSTPLYPAAYVKEIEAGARLIEGTNTSVVGFLGDTEEGPVSPVLIANWADYERVFGESCNEKKYLSYTIEGFFRNGGQKCYVRRVSESETDGLQAFKAGLADFAGIDDISVVYAPNASGATGYVRALIDHCETLRDRFAIIDSEKGVSDISMIDPQSHYDTKYAAFYYPWILIDDSETSSSRLVPPGGHIAGIYARTDAERGVHKAPAGVSCEVRGAIDLESKLDKNACSALSQHGVNCLRSYGGKIVVWGARTLSRQPSWRYVNVQRFLMYLERSIEKGTQWVMFEPNNEKLWNMLKQAIARFLTSQWKSGALQGTTPNNAFFVKCDQNTMTKDDIDNGRLIAIVGVAVTKPAEFLTLRFSWLLNR